MVALGRETVREVTQDCYVDLYISGALPSGWWPWRMQPADKTSSNVIEWCDTYILDSAFNNPDVSNEDVFDRGAALGADIVVLADVVGDMSDTVDSVLDGLDLLDDHHCELNRSFPSNRRTIRAIRSSVDRQTGTPLAASKMRALKRRSRPLKLSETSPDRTSGCMGWAMVLNRLEDDTTGLH